MSMKQNIEQQRAAFALESVLQAVVSLEVKQQDEFKAYITSLPSMVQMNGLGQAIAFYRSKFDSLEKPGTRKGSKAYSQIYQTLQTWLCADKGCDKTPAAVYGSGDLLAQLTQNDMYQYRLAQSELQKLLVWLKKLTAAYINNKA